MNESFIVQIIEFTCICHAKCRLQLFPVAVKFLSQPGVSPLTNMDIKGYYSATSII